jgi:hypothetical protein
MLLGEVIERFEDPAFAAEALLALDDLALAARVNVAAADEALPPGEYVIRSVGRFLQSASDEEWLTLIGLMSRADDPGNVFLRRVLSHLPGNISRDSR